MTYSEMRVDMRIRETATGLKATIAAISGGRFQIVDENGHVDNLNRYDAGEWEKIS